METKHKCPECGEMVDKLVYVYGEYYRMMGVGDEQVCEECLEAMAERAETAKYDYWERATDND